MAVAEKEETNLSGLEPLIITPESVFVNVGNDQCDGFEKISSID
jgi:hypothetical protein